MKKEIKHILITAAVALTIGALLGWWLGSRKEAVEVVREEVRYVERPATTIYVEKPTLVREEVVVHDTIYQREEVRIPIAADTTAIIADYLKRREYNLDFSTDTTGVFRVNAIVEANQLTSAKATIQPLQREVERIVYAIPPKFRPAIGAGIVVGNKVGLAVDVGAIIKDRHIVQALYMRLDKQNYYGASYSIIFGKR